MKHLFKVFAFALLIVFASCDKEDDVTKKDDTSNIDPADDKTPIQLVPGEEIIGTWKLVEMNYEGLSVASQGGITVNTEFWGEAYDIDYKLIFGDDKAFTADGGYSIELKTKVDYIGMEDFVMDTIVTNITDFVVLEEGTWDYKNDIYFIKTADVTDEVDIKMIDANTMSIPYEFGDQSVQQGANVNQDVTGSMLFVRE